MANDTFVVSVSGATVTLNGCVAVIRAAPDYAAENPGYIAAGGQWVECVGPYENYDPDDRAKATGMPAMWYVKGNTIRLSNPSADQLVGSVIYRVTGDSLQTTPDSPLMMDDSFNLLVAATAGYAMKGKGGQYDLFFADAYGPSGAPDGKGGILGGLIDIQIKQMQVQGFEANRFRTKNYSKRFAGNYGYITPR